jgi:tryptophan-rich sensory protein
MIKQFIILVGFILLSQAAGILGSLATVPNIESWYEFLIKPALNPPNWIFGPVWTTLYTLMGIASYLVWKSKGEDYKRALALFFAHLFVNAAWSIVFFGEQNIGLALGIIILLDLMLLEIIRRFCKISKTAGAILIPYLLWVLFATYLNGSIFFLN